MNPCVLILGQADPLDDIVGVCERLGLRPIFLAARDGDAPTSGHVTFLLTEWDVPTVENLARDSQARGIFPAAPEHWPLTAAVAKVLNRPFVDPEQGRDLLRTCADAFRMRGVPVAECRVIEDRADAEAAAEAVGAPVWIQALCHDSEPFIMRVDNPADAPLAWGQALERTASDALLVQKAVAGPTYCVVGFKEHHDYRPIDIIAEHRSSSAYPVVQALSLPAGLSGANHAKLVSLAEKAAHELPVATGCVLFRFAFNGNSPVLFDVRFAARPAAPVCALFHWAYGIDLLADALAVSSELFTRSASRKETAAWVQWLPGVSGEVSAVTGVEAARALPGVRHVCVNAKPGDTLRHVVDAPSRDAVGYVIAEGPTLAQAQQRAGEGCETAQVEASNVGAP